MTHELTAFLAIETPSPAMGELTTYLLLASLGCTLAAVGLIIAVVLLSRPTTDNTDRSKPGSHRAMTDKERWHARIDDIVERYDQGEINRDEAFISLAGLAREFASTGFNRNMANHTLADLKREPRIPSNQQSLDLLRATIAALYPPEFADAQFNDQARVTTVEDAATWVATLVERWR